MWDVGRGTWDVGRGPGVNKVQAHFRRFSKRQRRRVCAVCARWKYLAQGWCTGLRVLQTHGVACRQRQEAKTGGGDSAGSCNGSAG
jgi:hypothetical protein